jgi:hypothetical protein
MVRLVITHKSFGEVPRWVLFMRQRLDDARIHLAARNYNHTPFVQPRNGNPDERIAMAVYRASINAPVEIDIVT